MKVSFQVLTVFETHEQNFLLCFCTRPLVGCICVEDEWWMGEMWECQDREPNQPVDPLSV